MRRESIKRFIPYFLKYKVLLLITFIGMVVSSITSAIIPYLIKNVIDTLIATKDFGNIKNFLAFVLIAVIANIIFKLTQIYVGNYAGQRIMQDIRHDLFYTVARFKIASFSKEPSGKIITRITNDVENMNDLLNAGLVSLFADLLFITLAVGFLIFINPGLGLIVLSPLPIAVIFALYLGNIVERIYEKVRDALTKMNIHMQEVLTGIHVVQIFNMEKGVIEKFKGYAKDFRDNFYKSQVTNVILRQSVNISSYISIFLLVLVGGIFTIKGHGTIGTIISFSSYLSYLYGPLGDLSDKFSILQNAISSMVKIDEFIKGNEIEENFESGERFEVKGKVTLDNIFFSYDNSNDVLKGVNIEVEKGESVAIVGFTGAGKTTIANLIFGFYDPTYGTVAIDDHDLKFACKSNFRRYLGMVLQNVFIFRGTVLDNITLGDNYSVEDVEKVCNMLGIYDYIQRLPNGLYTELSTEGKNISMGERQLISFARALIHNPRILILDEATSSIDSHTEELIEKGTKILMEGRTSIIIAHRLSTIRHVNRIYVLNKGRIVEEGTHEQLLEKKGLYYEFYKSQYK
ncbi:MAG: ABC transporter ATP-binding protein [Caldisericum sp.]|uniref:ABC transporter ATP-binding protein n=1 Tax=Caldisericum sp. TaxID=2499687 RepID=UPI003D0CB2D8